LRTRSPRRAGPVAVRRQRSAAGRSVVLLQPHAVGQGAQGSGRQPAGRPSQRHQRRESRQRGLHVVRVPQRRRRRPHHAHHQDGLRLRVHAGAQGLRRRHHRRPHQPCHRGVGRAVRGRSRAVQRVLRLVGLQRRAGVPPHHPGAADALAQAPRLRGARRVSAGMPGGAGSGGAGYGRVGAWLRGGLLVAFLAVLVALPLIAGPFGLRLANLVGMYALVVLGLVLLTGYGGLASLGQAAFVGTGAYTAAVLASRFGVNPWLSIVAGVLLSVALAWVIGLVTLRLKGHYLALATLAWGLVITGVLRNWMS